MIIIIIGIYATSNYNENENKINVKPVVSYTLDTIPAYSSDPYITINNNKPNFEDEYFIADSFEEYSNLDDNKRCGVAFANLSKEGTMPKENENRKSLDKVIPAGWQDTSYPELNLS